MCNLRTNYHEYLYNYNTWCAAQNYHDLVVLVPPELLTANNITVLSLQLSKAY